MAGFSTKPLDECTWTDFAGLVEHQGFERTRRIGKNRWVVTKVVRRTRKAS
jgi:hypothetical protein